MPIVCNKFPFLFLVYFLSIIKLSAQFSAQRQFTTRDGLLSNEVYYTIKATSGYTYHFTEFGIAKNTGHSMQTVGTNLPDSMLTAYGVCMDEQGIIYFYNSKKRLCLLRNDSAFVIADLRTIIGGTYEMYQMMLLENQILIQTTYNSYIFDLNNKQVKVVKPKSDNAEYTIQLFKQPYLYPIRTKRKRSNRDPSDFKVSIYPPNSNAPIIYVLDRKYYFEKDRLEVLMGTYFLLLIESF
jgi:hypothetical protein